MHPHQYICFTSSRVVGALKHTHRHKQNKKKRERKKHTHVIVPDNKSPVEKKRSILDNTTSVVYRVRGYRRGVTRSTVERQECPHAWSCSQPAWSPARTRSPSPPTRARRPPAPRAAPRVSLRAAPRVLSLRVSRQEAGGRPRSTARRAAPLHQPKVLHRTARRCARHSRGATATVKAQRQPHRTPRSLCRLQQTDLVAVCTSMRVPTLILTLTY